MWRRAPSRWSSPIRPSNGRPKSGRPKSGRPKSGRPKSGRPKSGRPKSGRPKGGRAGGRRAAERAAEERAAEERAAEERAAEERAAEERAAEERAAEERAAEERAAEERAAEERAAEERAAEERAAEEAAPACSASATLEPVVFGFGSAALTEDAQILLDESFRTVAECASLCLTLNGYGDPVEPGGARPLSTQRAEAVFLYLIGQGYDADRMRAVGRGAEPQPELGPDDDFAEADRRARRVDLVVAACPR